MRTAKTDQTGRMPRLILADLSAQPFCIQGRLYIVENGPKDNRGIDDTTAEL